MKIRTKLLMSFLAVGLTTALVGGSTMAWFTDSKPVSGATFTAGTVLLDGDSSVQVDGPTTNVNPGDTLKASLKIVNSGSKAVWIRVKLPEYYWRDPSTLTKDSGLGTSVFTDYAIDTGKGGSNLSDWTVKGGYAYYKFALPGTEKDGKYDAGDLTARTITPSVAATLDGEKTGNAYQGQQFYLSDLTVEAIQATNSADTLDAAWATGTSSEPASLAQGTSSVPVA